MWERWERWRGEDEGSHAGCAPSPLVFTPLPVDANAFSRQTRSCVCLSFLLVAPFAFSIPFHTQLDNLSFFFASCFLLFIFLMRTMPSVWSGLAQTRFDPRRLVSFRLISPATCLFSFSFVTALGRIHFLFSSLSFFFRHLLFFFFSLVLDEMGWNYIIFNRIRPLRVSVFEHFGSVGWSVGWMEENARHVVFVLLFARLRREMVGPLLLLLLLLLLCTARPSDGWLSCAVDALG